MPHDHAHPHHHHHASADLAGDKRVAWAVAVNILLTVVQIIAGLFSGSLALIADGIHNLSDALSLVIAFLARRIARRPADAAMTFGYGRAEVVAALVNYTTLIVIAVMLAFEGIERLFNPAEVEGWTVVVVAAVALVIDTATALLILSLQKGSVNMRAAFLHNVADALGSVAVIIGGTLILLYDWRLVDPIVTLMISGYILWHAASEVGPVIRLLMLGSPDSPGVAEVAEGIRGVEGVAGLHHLHLWRMQESEAALEAHVVLTGAAEEAGAVRARIVTLLHDRFALTHVTLQLETRDEACPDAPLIGH